MQRAEPEVLHLVEKRHGEPVRPDLLGQRNGARRVPGAGAHPADPAGAADRHQAPDRRGHRVHPVVVTLGEDRPRGVELPPPPVQLRVGEPRAHRQPEAAPVRIEFVHRDRHRIRIRPE
nr:hypothetical protein [Actinophytocola sp.]